MALLPMVSVMWVVSVADLGGDLQSHLEGLRILLPPASVLVLILATLLALASTLLSTRTLGTLLRSQSGRGVKLIQIVGGATGTAPESERASIDSFFSPL